MSKLIFTLIASVVLTAFTSAQSLSREQMVKDLRYLDKRLTNWYPGLGYYTPGENYKGHMDSLVSNLPASLSYLDFFREVTPLIGIHKDGHLNIFHRKKYSDKNTPLLPLALREAGGKYYVVFNTSPDSLPARGAEVVSLEGREIKELHELFSDRFRGGADGDIGSGRYFRNLVGFGSSYFNWFGARDSLLVRYLPPGSTDTLQKYIRCESAKVSNSYLSKRYASDLRLTKNLSLTVLDSASRTAVLTVLTFSSFKKWDPFNTRFKKKVRGAFQEVHEKGYENLVVDLRSNGGGAIINSSLLLSYLLPESYRIFSSSSIKPKAVGSYITRNLNPISPVHFFVHHRRDPQTGLWHSKPRGEDRKTKPNTRHPFRGKVYFLANGGSYSASVSVLAHARSQAVGQLVGEAPGGAYWGDFASRFRIITLPNSRIRVRIPLKKLYHGVKPSDKIEITPDYPVSRTYEDIVTPGRDFGLEYVKQLIRKSP